MDRKVLLDEYENIPVDIDIKTLIADSGTDTERILKSVMKRIQEERTEEPHTQVKRLPRKKIIIGIIAAALIICMLGMTTMGAAHSEAAVIVKRVTSTEQVENAREFFDTEVLELKNSYNGEMTPGAMEDMKSDDIYVVSNASARITIDAGKYASKIVIGRIINTVKRAGYLPSNYSYDKDYNFDDSKSRNNYLMAVCNTLNDGNFTMTEYEEKRLIGQLAFAYHYGHASGDTLKAIENTIIPG